MLLLGPLEKALVLTVSNDINQFPCVVLCSLSAPLAWRVAAQSIVETLTSVCGRQLGHGFRRGGLSLLHHPSGGVRTWSFEALGCALPKMVVIL